jgi:hypothetical protein
MQEYFNQYYIDKHLRKCLGLMSFLSAKKCRGYIRGMLVKS